MKNVIAVLIAVFAMVLFATKADARRGCSGGGCCGQTQAAPAAQAQSPCCPGGGCCAKIPAACAPAIIPLEAKKRPTPVIVTPPCLPPACGPVPTIPEAPKRAMVPGQPIRNGVRWLLNGPERRQERRAARRACCG